MENQEMLADWKLRYLEDICLYVLSQRLVFNLSHFFFKNWQVGAENWRGQRKQNIDKDADAGSVLEAVVYPAVSVCWSSWMQANWLMKQGQRLRNIIKVHYILIQRSNTAGQWETNVNIWYHFGGNLESIPTFTLYWTVFCPEISARQGCKTLAKI